MFQVGGQYLHDDRPRPRDRHPPAWMSYCRSAMLGSTSSPFALRLGAASAALQPGGLVNGPTLRSYGTIWPRAFRQAAADEDGAFAGSGWAAFGHPAAKDFLTGRSKPLKRAFCWRQPLASAATEPALCCGGNAGWVWTPKAVGTLLRAPCALAAGALRQSADPHPGQHQISSA